MSGTERRWLAITAAVLTATGTLAIWVGTGWIFWVGIGLVFAGALAGIVSLAPDIQVLIDADARTITRNRRFPWQGAARTTELPFSAVYSIGVTRIHDSEGGDRHIAVLRLNGGRDISLWDIATGRRKGRDLDRFVATDPDLQQLQQLTGFRREDRLD